MYRVLIVDDEIISRLGVTNLLNWEAHGFQLVDSVVNGYEAIESMRQQPIDLVITDIKMPVMTGIELMKAAKEEGFKSAFIVLSSFDDYVFVREALKMGALDYILKLDLDAEHMAAVLEKAKEYIRWQSTEKMPTHVMDKQMLQSARKDYLKEIIYGQISFDKTYEERREHLSLKLPYKNYCVLMFKVKDLDKTLNEDGIRQVIEEILEDYDYAYICETGYEELSIVYNMNAYSEHEQYQTIHRLTGRINFIMKQYFNQKVTIYVSQTFGSVEDVPLAYLQVCQTFSLKSFVSDDMLVFYDEVMRNRDYRDYRSFENYINRFEKTFQKGSDESVNAIMDDLFSYVEKSKYIELGQVRFFMSSLAYITNNYLDKLGYANKLLWKSEEEKYAMLQGIHRKEDFIHFLLELQENLNAITKDNSDNYIIRHVIKYLKEHYQEGIVLKDVADQFGVTNTYLSMLFKKETGETLKEYLTGLKIEKAKRLLKETHEQVIEISKEVGYDNEHYFSRMFKQKTGMTPTSYRNSAE